MMKVQSLRLLESLNENFSGRNSGVVLLSDYSKHCADKVLILDGPFAETKECCSHVALLAQHSRKQDPSSR